MVRAPPRRARRAPGHLEIETVDGLREARWYENCNGSLELTARASGGARLVVDAPLPFEFTPSRLDTWFARQQQDLADLRSRFQ